MKDELFRKYKQVEIVEHGLHQPFILIIWLK